MRRLQFTKERLPLEFLLLSLVFVLLVAPLLEHLAAGRLLFHAGITLVLLSAAVAGVRRTYLLVAGLCIVAVAAPLGWAAYFSENSLLFLISSLLEAAFFTFVAVRILLGAVLRHTATIQSIYGAICSYLLLGLAFATVYWGIEMVMPESFARPSVVGVPDSTQPVGTFFSEAVYFSMVTMSTLGYGDITPLTPTARTLSWMQAVLGQFYIAVIVAWLISEIAATRRVRQPRDLWKDSTDVPGSSED